MKLMFNKTIYNYITKGNINSKLAVLIQQVGICLNKIVGINLANDFI